MSTTRRTNLWYNFSYLGIIQVTNFLLSLLVIPYVVKVVGTDGFGVIAVAQVLIFYLAVMVDYGFNRTAIRDVAIYRDNSERVSAVFSTVIVSKLLLSIVTFLLLILLVAIVPLFRAHSILYLMAFSFVIGQSLLMNWFFQGLEKMNYTAVASLIARLVFVLLVFAFIKERSDVIYYLFFMGIGNIIAGIGSIIYAKRKYRLQFRFPGLKIISLQLKEGWAVTVSNLSMTTIQYIGIFILRLFTSDLIVGFYSIAEKVYFAMKMMLDVFTQAAYPRVCILLQDGTTQVKQFFQRSFLPFLAMLTGGTAVIFILAPTLIHFFAHTASPATSLLLRGLCVAVIIVCLGIPASLVLLAGDHKKNYLRIYSGGMVVCILSNLALSPYLEARGTVAAVLITEIAITAGLYSEVLHIYKTGRQTATTLPD
jgi:PST family polysaccharide transporter